MADGQTFGITLKFDGSEVQTGTAQATSQISALGEASERAGGQGKGAFTALTAASSAFAGQTSTDIKQILDRYDPLGAKLRQLQQDFRALSVAANTGDLGMRDDSRADLALSKIQEGINGIKGAAPDAGAAVATAGAKMVDAAEKSAFATAGARRELIVLGHEAISGNFSRMPGSVMVLAERIGVAGAAMLSVAAPIAAVAVGIGLVAKAAYDGNEEMKGMNNALATTSGFAGLTRGSMRQLADEMAHTGQVTIGQGKDIVTALVASGQIGAQSIGAVAKLASTYAQDTGQDIAKIAPQLTKLFADPARGAEALNQSMHFLTAAELDHLHALEMAGKAGEAQLELAHKLTAFLPDQTRQMGLLENAWDGLRKAGSAAWDAMLGIGRPDTLDEKLNALTNRMTILKFRQTDRSFWSVALGLGGGNANDQVEMADIQKKINALQAPIAAAQKKAAADAAAANKNANDQQTLGLLGDTTTARVSDLQAEIARVQEFAAATPKLAKEKAEKIKALKQQLADLSKTDDPLASYLDKTFDARSGEYDKLMAQLSARKELSADQLQDAGNAIWNKEFSPEKAALTTDFEAATKDSAARAKSIQEATDFGTQIDIAIAAAIGKGNGDAYDVAFAGVAKEIEAQQKKLDSTHIKNIDPAMYDQDKDKIDALATAKYRLAEATAASQSIQQVENDRNEKLKVLQAEVTDGVITQDEARRQGLSINQDALSALQQHLDVLKSLAADGYPPAIEQINKLNATIAKIADGAKAKTWADGLSDGLKSFAGTSVDTYATVKNATVKAMNSMTDSLTTFVKTGKLNFSSLADSIITDLIRIQIQNSITKPLAGAMSGFDFSSLAKLFTASAGGNVFSSPGLSAYSNQIVDRPTLFPFASGVGLMGEAGPEAIMPLTRGLDGRLGVQTAGGAGGVQVNVINNAAGTQATTQKRTDNSGRSVIDVFIGQVKSAIASDISRGSGAIPAAMTSTYGLNRAPGMY